MDEETLKVTQPEHGMLAVSEDKLRGMFLEFKLDLFTELQKYATLASLSAVEHRLDDMRAESEKRIAALERWRASQEGTTNTQRRFSAGIAAWVAITISIVTTFVLLYIDHHTKVVHP